MAVLYPWRAIINYVFPVIGYHPIYHPLLMLDIDQQPYACSFLLEAAVTRADKLHPGQLAAGYGWEWHHQCFQRQINNPGVGAAKPMGHLPCFPAKKDTKKPNKIETIILGGSFVDLPVFLVYHYHESMKLTKYDQINGTEFGRFRCFS